MTESMKATKKPWGKEYLLFENKDVAIWHLLIDPLQETSLHSHPNKKTGLVVLDGAAKVSFLSDHQKLFAGEKTMIRNGVFHQTKNMTRFPLDLLEIESPVDKADIVRLKDKYGRAGEPYSFDDVLDIEPINILNGPVDFHNCVLCHSKLDMVDHQKYEHLMMTAGKISFQDFDVASAGDILSVDNLVKFLDNFYIREPIEGLFVKSCL